MPGIQFGSFQGICETAALVVCPLLGLGNKGIEPQCYSRNVEVAGTLIFQPSTCFVHIVAIIMTFIMIFHVRSKYTAVGRKEILTFFWLYALISLMAMFLDSGIVPTASAAYPWIAAVYAGLVASAYTCLLINGFVGFQLAEDGTALSLWVLRGSCIVTFALGFLIAVGTFFSKLGFSGEKAVALWVVYIIWPVVCVAVYIILQLLLVIRTLDDRWPIGDILFGTAFFVMAQVLLFAFSNTICDAIKHYIDGLFFFTVCMLLSVMMVYKYWDSITKEDLEFSVGSKALSWEVKDPLLQGSSNSLAPPAQQYGGPDRGLYTNTGSGGSGSDDGSYYDQQMSGGPKRRFQ